MHDLPHYFVKRYRESESEFRSTAFEWKTSQGLKIHLDPPLEELDLFSLDRYYWNVTISRDARAKLIVRQNC